MFRGWELLGDFWLRHYMFIKSTFSNRSSRIQSNQRAAKNLVLGQNVHGSVVKKSLINKSEVKKSPVKN